MPSALLGGLLERARIREVRHPGAASPPEPRYTPSPTLAEFVRCRDLTCRFPGCDKPAQVCDLEPGEFIWSGGDCHLYANHLEQTDLQLSREPLPLPTMKLNPEVKDLFAFRFEDFELVGYQSHPHIKAPVAV